MRARVRLVVALAITTTMIGAVVFSANARNGAKAPRIKNRVFSAALKAEQGKAKWPIQLLNPYLADVLGIEREERKCCE